MVDCEMAEPGFTKEGGSPVNRKGICLIHCLILLSLLTGCWDRQELNQLAIISALGIDQTQDGKIIVYTQEINPQTVGGGGTESTGGGSGGQKTLLRMETGGTVADALFKLQSKVGRKLFWGQTMLVVFGEGIVRKGIQPQVDFLMRHPQMRLRANVFVSKDPGAVLEIQSPVETSSAQTLRNMVELRRRKAMDIRELAMTMVDDAQAAIIPHIQPTSKKIPFIYESVVIKEGKWAGKLNRLTTEGVLWHRNEMKNGSVSLNLPGSQGGAAGVRIDNSHVEMIPKIEQGEWSMTVRIHVEDDIEVNETVLSMKNPRFTQIIEEAAEKKIYAQAQKMLQRVQHDLRADILGFAEAFHRKYPREWEQVKDRWDQVFPRVKVNLQVKVDVERVGLTTWPAGLPLDKVKKK